MPGNDLRPGRRLREMMPDPAICIAASIAACDTFDSERALDATNPSPFRLCRRVMIGAPSPPSAPPRSLPGFCPRPRCPIDASPCYTSVPSVPTDIDATRFPGESSPEVSRRILIELCPGCRFYARAAWVHLLSLVVSGDSATSDSGRRHPLGWLSRLVGVVGRRRVRPSSAPARSHHGAPATSEMTASRLGARTDCRVAVDRGPAHTALLHHANWPR